MASKSLNHFNPYTLAISKGLNYKLKTLHIEKHFELVDLPFPQNLATNLNINSCMGIPGKIHIHFGGPWQVAEPLLYCIVCNSATNHLRIQSTKVMHVVYLNIWKRYYENTNFNIQWFQLWWSKSVTIKIHFTACGLNPNFCQNIYIFRVPCCGAGSPTLFILRLMTVLHPTRCYSVTVLHPTRYMSLQICSFGHLGNFSPAV